MSQPPVRGVNGTSNAGFLALLTDSGQMKHVGLDQKI
jgi:hypothetical protein